MKTQKIGKALYLALLMREVLNCEGVANCRVKLPQADVYPLEKKFWFCLSVLFPRWSVSKGEEADEFERAVLFENSLFGNL